MDNYIGLSIEQINPEVEKDGLTVNALRMEIEEVLSNEGIKLLSKKECLENLDWRSQGEPRLKICPRIIKNAANKYVFRIDMEFEQLAHPIHYHDVSSLSATWKIGCEGRSSDIRDIRRIIKDGAEMFLNIYSLFNPKEKN